MSEATGPVVKLRVVQSVPRETGTKPARPFLKITPDYVGELHGPRGLLCFKPTLFDDLNRVAGTGAIVEAELGDTAGSNNYIVAIINVAELATPGQEIGQAELRTTASTDYWYRRPISPEDRAYEAREQALDRAAHLYGQAYRSGIETDIDVGGVIAAAAVFEQYLMHGSDMVDGLIAAHDAVIQAEIDEVEAPDPEPTFEEMADEQRRTKLGAYAEQLGWSVSDLRLWLKKPGNGFGLWGEMNDEQKLAALHAMADRVDRHQNGDQG